MKTQQIEDQATTTCIRGSGLARNRREQRSEIWRTGFKLPDHNRREKKMKQVISQAILSVLLVLLATTPAGATEFWVDGLDGDDASDGLTVATATRTIQIAVNLATTAGDIVNILPGSFACGFRLDPANAQGASGITIRGIGAVVIRADNLVLGVSGPLTRIENITFRGPSNLTLLTLNNSSELFVDRCRVLESGQGIIAFNGNITIRECLFLRNGVGLVGATSVCGLRVERCTFARNGKGFSSVGDKVLFDNCAFFENDNASSTVGSVPCSHCSFFGDPTREDRDGDVFIGDACPTTGEQVATICDLFPPLFIDPDSDVYYVRKGSPLLDHGQDDGQIGAFGQGFHTSRDVTKDEGLSDPAQGPTAWAAWIDSNGDALTASSLVELNDDDEVLLREGILEASLYSPVFDTESAFTVIRSVDFSAFEDTFPAAAGSRKIIDAVQNTPRREVRIRTHKAAEGTFSQDPSVTPPSFSAVDKHVKFERRAQFVQMELVLRADGD